MTLFKHTEPPMKSGYYHTDNGYFYFNEDTGRWTDLVDSDWEERVKFWYSPLPPKEIEEVLNRLEYNLSLANQQGQCIVYSDTIEQLLLKLRAE